MRLQKFLARADVASRRAAEKLIESGRVRVNGEPVTELGTRIDPEHDRVDVDGQSVAVPRTRWIAFHKPAGLLTTRSDDRGRRTVYDVLPAELAGLRYVGRLDRETEGLLLLTNDGDAAHSLLHPSGEVEREYRARVSGPVSDGTLRALEAGVELDDGFARARRVGLVASGGRESTLAIVLTEGRKREVRRMLAAVGAPVLRLTRVRFGPIELAGLAPGAWRDLSSSEREALAAATRGPTGPAQPTRKRGTAWT